MVRFHYQTPLKIKNMNRKIITTLVCLIILGLVFFAACSVEKEKVQYYNVTYYQDNKAVVYHDVTDLSQWEGKITFTTCDGMTVVLYGGRIEIERLELD